MAENPDDLWRGRRLAEMSAALDGEAPQVDDLDEGAAAFRDTALRIRQAVRVEEAAVPPDVTQAVLAEIQTREGPRADHLARNPIQRHLTEAEPASGEPSTVGTRRPFLLVASLAFLVAAVVTGLVVNPGWREGGQAAVASVPERLLSAQQDLDRLDAAVTLVEQGAHPDVPIRRYQGSLRYRAPEQLWLSLQDVSARPSTWPANDVELLIRNGSVWQSGLRGCPVVAQPGCLGSPRTRAAVGLMPFAEDIQAPLDLVIPTGGFLADDQVSDPAVVWRQEDGLVAVQTTVAQVRPLVDVLTGIGAVRQVHSSDPVRLTLDGQTLSLLALSVRAGSGDARANWAAANGYVDQPGNALLNLTVQPSDSAIAAPVPPAAAPARDGGFVQDAAPPPHWADDLVLSDLPGGFEPHRSGHIAAGGPTTMVRSYSDGRAWFTVEWTTDWDQSRLFGDLGPTVRPVDVGSGTGYKPPTGDVVALHTAEVDIVVRGSVPSDLLVRVAEGLTRDGESVTGRALPGDWDQADLLTELPPGALRPQGALTARRLDDGAIVVAVPGAGSSGATLTQRRGQILPPPVKADVVEVAVRGLAGRWSAPLGLLVWQEDGWIHELRSEGLDRSGLVRVAESLVLS